MIRLEGVGQRYRRGPLVVEGVELAIGPGEPVVVLGENGSGKSTLLRVIAGCGTPSEGRVTGRPVTVGYVPDRFPAHLRMSAASYLRHLRRIRGRSAGDPVELLERLGFSGGLSTPMSRLSKGNAQKVGLVQALTSGAELLVLDEPWSGLDVGVRPVLTTEITALSRTTAVVLTDHTGTADALPGRRKLRLHDRRLRDEAHEGAGGESHRDRTDAGGDRGGSGGRGTVVITLSCPEGLAEPVLAEAARLGATVEEVRRS
ncbi:ATP-binding cassette domain-containing protein [Amycolatopsis sp. 195334CR]|uniref:ABC transporter ATP-binding protein n=1 Tax=Amycolatopsis sp. 195334CR TaxID=2814588 RepID=UPI001A8CFBBD|nr:ATP-binding cassette domain-containing protein [Amycolatopsis sp. 195334CR]MBN6033909.1 ABC transporter ATP-binding protein [Amycolatopsis sp. 195334CR]